MDLSSPISNLLQYLQSFAPLSPAFQQEVRLKAVERTLHKGEVYVRKGGYDQKVGFLSSGIMRIYDTDFNGQDWNKALLTYQTILLGNPQLDQKAIHSIATITACEVVELPIEFLSQALAKFPEVSQIRDKIMVSIYTHKSHRESDLLSLPAKDHYLKLIDALGDMLTYIPQYHIASYLGITPIQLSRIKSSLQD